MDRLVHGMPGPSLRRPLRRSEVFIASRLAITNMLGAASGAACRRDDFAVAIERPITVQLDQVVVLNALDDFQGLHSWSAPLGHSRLRMILSATFCRRSRGLPDFAVTAFADRPNDDSLEQSLAQSRREVGVILMVQLVARRARRIHTAGGSRTISTQLAQRFSVSRFVARRRTVC